MGLDVGIFLFVCRPSGRMGEWENGKGTDSAFFQVDACHLIV